MPRPWPKVLLLGTCLPILAAGPACRRDEPIPIHKTISGTAESIDEASNQVSMRWYNDKKQRDEIVSGVVTDQTEILINGRVARLGHIRVGDRVKVTGRILLEPSNAPYIATRIEVARDDFEPDPTATRPAATASAPAG
jgi:hypothetical protein